MPTLIYDEYTGQTSQYYYLSERLPLFLEKYPPTEGWRVEVDMTDALSMRPGLLALAKVALGNGKALADIGLADEAAKLMVANAKLLNQEGHVVLTASACRPILEAKDWERLETAARQRLVAAAGFDGSTLNAEEDEAIAEVRVLQQQRLARGKTGPVGAVESKVSSAAVTTAAPTVVDSPSAQVQRPSDDGVPAEPPAENATVEDDPVLFQQEDGSQTPPADEQLAPAGLIRTIELMAQQKNRQVPVCRTLAEAQRAMQELIAA